MPSPANESKPEQEVKALEALHHLIKKIKDGRLTGEHSVAVNSNQGGITKIRIKTEEQI